MIFNLHAKLLALSAVVLLALSACDDESSFVRPGDEDSSSSVIPGSSGDLSSSSVTPQSSSSETSVSSSSSKVPEPVEGSSVASSSSARSSSSAEPALSSAEGGEDLSSSSSAKSSSSISSSSSAKSSSSIASSSSAKSSSSSAKSSSSTKSSSSVSSSSEYVPFDHSQTLAGAWRIGEDRYKTFKDPRNGRSYYYITITGTDTVHNVASVTVMAENLNIGDMVLGENDQNNDSKIERYCYNNDTTKCDEFGGLYQWAEMMQLPSRCNTESCADLIQENHQGICPDGWRLFNFNDYVIIINAEGNDDGVKGMRSTYGFSGTNYSGFSLVGAGLRNTNGTFSGLRDRTAWFRPEEYAEEPDIRAHHGLIGSSGSAPQQNHRELKAKGFSVRCTKLEE